MNFNKTIFFVLVLGFGMFTADNYAGGLNDNTKVDITSDDREIESYNSSENFTFIKPQQTNILYQQKCNKAMVKKIFYVLVISGLVTITLFLYLKLNDECYMQEKNC